MKIRSIVAIVFSVILTVTSAYLLPAVQAEGANGSPVGDERMAGDGSVLLDADHFPDPSLLAFAGSYDADGDGALSALELSAAEYVILDHAGITTLRGIEYFSHMKLLDCSGNALEALDLDGCAALENLYCANNRISALDVSPCPRLAELDCSGNQLTALALENCEALRWLVCTGNALVSLSLGEKPSLEGLYCYGNPLTDLDVSGCPLLVDHAGKPGSEVTDVTGVSFVYYGSDYRPGCPGLGTDAGLALAVTAEPTLAYAAPFKMDQGLIVSLGEGESVQLSLSDTLEMPVHDGFLIWHSADRGVANVNQSGLVQGIRAGQTTISVDCGAYGQLSCDVVVGECPRSVLLEPAAMTLTPGARAQLSALLEPDGSVAQLIWMSSDNGVATVDAVGFVYGETPGVAVITVRTPGGASAMCDVTVETP